MIQVETTQEVAGLANILSDKGVLLTATQDSPVHELLNSITGVPSSLENIDKELYTLSANGEFNEVLTKHAGLAIDSVRRTVALIKSDVIPRIHSIVATSRALQESNTTDLMPFNVRLVQVDKLLLLNETESLVSRYKALDPQTPVGNLVPSVAAGTFSTDIDSLVTAVKYTDSGDFNSKMEATLRGDVNLAMGVSNFLEGNGSLTSVTSATGLLAILIVLQNLEVPGEGVHVTLGDFKRNRLWAIKTVSTTLLNMIEKYRLDIEKNNLYCLGMGKGDSNTIFLNADVYKDMVQRHNLTIEMIIGNSIAGKPYNSREFVIETVQNELTAIYEKEMNRLKSKATATKTSEDRRIVFKCIMDDMRKVSTSPEVLNILNDTPESLMKRAAQICLAIDETHFTGENVEENIVAVAVSSILYAHTDVPILLNLMELISKNNPDFTVEQIRVAAIIDRVASYCVDQVMCVK